MGPGVGLWVVRARPGTTCICERKDEVDTYKQMFVPRATQLLTGCFFQR